MDWSFWLELFVRSAVLLSLGEVVRRRAKGQSAIFRYRLVFGVFVLLAVLPLLSALLPGLRIPLPKAATSERAIVSVQEVSSAIVHSPSRPSLNWLLLVWGAGSCAALMPMLAGMISAWRLVRRATPFRNMYTAGAEVLLSKELDVPVTAGVVRPRILLPASAESWDPARLRMVLAHEAAHVQRNDVAAQMAVHVIAALWWFQPLVWMLRGVLRKESEFACDVEAVRSGFRPSEYAAELLEVAKALQGGYRFSSSAISMARSRDLETRVRNILNAPAAAVSGSMRRTCTAALALAAAAITASALTFSSDPNPRGGSHMKRTILSALLTTAGLSAATVSGTIHDASGNALSGVNVVIYNADTHAQQETATDASGRFSFSGGSAGQYIFRAEKAGYSSIIREFDLKADSDRERELTMVSEGDQQVADKVAGASEAQPNIVRIGGRVAQSNLVTKVQPVYPAAAKAARTQGTVEIESVLSKDGVPVELRVLSSPSDDLSQSALEAVRQWRYRPTLLNGAPIEVVTDVIVNYTLAQ